MSLPRYPGYKDSGIQWIGKVPSHWIRRTLQDTARSGRNAFVDGPFGSDLKSEEYADDGVPLIQLNNVAIGKHDLTNLKFIPEKKADELARHKAMPGDIVIAKMAAPVARAAIVSSDFEKFVIVADCVKLSVDASQWNANFLQYWINSSGVNAVAETLSAGITRLRINLGSLKKLPVFHTSLPEQTAIATFLDRETGKIDALIAEQEKLLALLAEKRQATISHAVTKGLNPDAPMKDSGVAWLGEVPEHWETIRLGALFREVSEPGNEELPVLSVSIHDGVSDKELDEMEMDRKVTRSDNRSKYKAVAPGDLTYNMMRAWQGGFGTVLVEGMVSPAYVVARPVREFSTSLIEQQLRTPTAVTEMKRHSRGITDFRLRLYWDEFKTICVALPPKSEQDQIISFIESESFRLSALAEAANRSIALLKERRAALITAAVTGKISVMES